MRLVLGFMLGHLMTAQHNSLSTRDSCFSVGYVLHGQDKSLRIRIKYKNEERERKVMCYTLLENDWLAQNNSKWNMRHGTFCVGATPASRLEARGRLRLILQNEFTRMQSLNSRYHPLR